MDGVVAGVSMRLIAIEYGSASDFDRVFANMIRERPDAVMMTGDAFHHLQILRIMDFSMKNKLPVILQTRQDIDAGGLMSYGPNHIDLSVARPIMCIKFCKEKNPAIYPSSSRRDLCSSSISRPPRPSASPSRQLCSAAPTR